MRKKHSRGARIEPSAEWLAMVAEALNGRGKRLALAKALGIAPSTVTRSVLRNPSDKVANAASDYLGIPRPVTAAITHAGDLEVLAIMQNIRGADPVRYARIVERLRKISEGMTAEIEMLAMAVPLNRPDKP